MSCRFSIRITTYVNGQHAVEDRDSGGSFQPAARGERGRGPHHVVGLPLAGFAIRVHQRNALFVDAAGLAVDIGRVVVVIQNLQFIAAIAFAGRSEENAAVATGLIRAGDIGRDAVFDMELVVGEGAFGLDIPCVFVNGEDAVRYDPGGWGAVGDFDPFVFILAIEEDNGIGGCVAALWTRGYDRWDRRIDFGGAMIFDRVVLGPCDGHTCHQAEGGK